MNAELLALIKSLAGSTENLILWYMILEFIKSISTNIAWVLCFFAFGYGLARGFKAIDKDIRK